MSDKLISELSALGLEVSQNKSLANYTSWKVGGPAEYFVEVANKQQLSQAIKCAQNTQIDYLIIGGGSNILVADKGLPGLVVKNRSTNIKIADEPATSTDLTKQDLQEQQFAARLVQLDVDQYYSFAELDYQEQDTAKVQVEIDSGVSLSYAINFLIGQGVTGLQWFSGIPGTLGGAIYNNIHGGSHFISEYVSSVEVMEQSGKISCLNKDQLQFDYDYSRFHNSNETILSVKLMLNKGDKDRALKTSIAWALKKKLQPKNSAGCCFQNLSSQEQTNLKLAANGWGYIIDQILKLKGTKIGGATISPVHAAFIETDNTAKAEDILQLFDLIYDKARQILGITPKLEIVLLGFSQQVVDKYR